MRQSTTRNALEIQESCYSTCRNEKSFPGVFTRSETHGCFRVNVWVWGGRLAGIRCVWNISWRWKRSCRPKQIWELRDL